VSGVASRVRLLFSIDLRSLAAFRVMLAIAMLASLIVTLFDVRAFLTDDGILPRPALIPTLKPGAVSLYLANGSYAFALALILVNIAAALSLLVGWRTRAATVACWLLYVSMDVRNFLTLQGGDQLIGLLLFWAMFLPTGAVFSVDAALDPRNRRNEPPLFSVATVGLLLHALYVYFFGALLKTGREWVPDGTAVMLAISLDTYATRLAVWFRDLPALMTGLTFYVWFLEIFSPLLLFFPDRHLRVRSTAIGLLVLMHIGFRLFINIGHFWLVSIASLAAFVPHVIWGWLGRRYWRSGQERIVIYYDRDCGFCRKTALILREFFLPRSVAVLPAQSVAEIGDLLDREQSWVVVDPVGTRHLHWEALVYICRQSLLLHPIGSFLAFIGFIRLGDPLYRLIGRSRRLLGTVTGWLLPERPNTLNVHPVMAILLGFVILVCFLFNARDHMPASWRPYLPPQPYVEVSRALGLVQRWPLFAPRPLRFDTWPVVAGLTRDGRTVDLATGNIGAVSRKPPEHVASGFRSYRWRRYLNRIAQYPAETGAAYFELYAAYLCRDWNRRHAGDDDLLTVSFHLVRKEYVAPGNYRSFETDAGSWPCAPS
jgi:hypothetical protein